MIVPNQPMCTSFAGSRMIATGSLFEVALQSKARLDAGEQENILIFDDETSNVIEIDFRGQIETFKSRLAEHCTNATVHAGTTNNTETTYSTESGARGRGRPKLGVVAREVTLLPRHWEWLNQQPGGASVALRKLVEEAKRTNIYKDERRFAQNSTYKFMSAMAGNSTGFEEATRALFAANKHQFHEHMKSWPSDIKAHIQKISEKAFA
ncbi:MAG: DUF2239 family protein [Cyanobacteria bacterium SZAS-4]|nr:DUF2239 family protein [Cyanobacteria bacterium SZAS-4]